MKKFLFRFGGIGKPLDQTPLPVAKEGTADQVQAGIIAYG